MNRKQRDLIKKRKRVTMGVRRRVRGVADKPRLSVFRSNRHMYCQAIDDEGHTTLATVSTMEEGFKKGQDVRPVDHAKALGSEMASRLKAKGIERVAFDRGRYKYHGKVKAFADAMREEGIRF